MIVRAKVETHCVVLQKRSASGSKWNTRKTVREIKRVPGWTSSIARWCQKSGHQVESVFGVEGVTLTQEEVEYMGLNCGASK